ncbi:hypothetical protein TNCV_5135371 [Trichonephila clavipes]|nr:hypothetical protein TNCV_5135371 [Trichonephila clavipes]
MASQAFGTIESCGTGTKPQSWNPQELCDHRRGVPEQASNLCSQLHYHPQSNSLQHSHTSDFGGAIGGNSSGARTATAGSDVVQSGRPIFDDFFQHLWPYIGNNTANVVFEMVKRLWLIRIDQ